METKALFLPLIKKYFEAFEQGLKREEYRRPALGTSAPVALGAP